MSENKGRFIEILHGEELTACPDDKWGDCPYRTAFGNCLNPCFSKENIDDCDPNPAGR